MKTTLQMTCECCDAPATATFDGDEFEGVTCSKHGVFLMVPTAQIEGMRAVLRERSRADALEAELRHAARAYAIADLCMRIIIESEGTKLDETGLLFGLRDEDRGEVLRLADASEGIQEAWEWLDYRRLAVLIEGPDGDQILLSDDE